MSEHISNLVESKLKKIKEEKNVFDTGKVIRLKDYIIEVSGLENVAYYEKVTIRGKGMGYVNEIKENSVIISVVKEDKPIEIGDTVNTTGERFRAIFAEEALGRVTDLFGVDLLTGRAFEKFKLDKMSQTNNHQGVIAIVPPFEYSSVEDIVEEAKKRNEQPFILILDGIEDPHNLGSIIRTAETAGVHGIIIPKRRAAAVNSTVNKVSAGAVQYMKIARVNNINETIKYLKSNDIWICGTDMNTNKYYYEENYNIPIAFVIGSEGFGISRLVKENCDFLVKIPMSGKISSLNASVSAGIVMYEAVKQRKNK